MINPGDPILVESPVYACVAHRNVSWHGPDRVSSLISSASCRGVIPMFQSLHCDQIGMFVPRHCFNMYPLPRSLIRMVAVFR